MLIIQADSPIPLLEILIHEAGVGQKAPLRNFPIVSSAGEPWRKSFEKL